MLKGHALIRKSAKINTVKYEVFVGAPEKSIIIKGAYFLRLPFTQGKLIPSRIVTKRVFTNISAEQIRK